MHTWECTYEVKGQLAEVSFLHMGSGDRIQVVRLAGEHFRLLSYLSGMRVHVHAHTHTDEIFWELPL